MTTNHTSPDAPPRPSDSAGRDELAALFAAALEGDRSAERALHLWGGFDENARRASWALLTPTRETDEPMPPHVLASIDRIVAALRDATDLSAPSS
ncbi:hypothetical protein Acsp06_65120 [Actinomycetospora sp. NBRC 106375]|uniref:hypothetical protein n=1 Tax=Actinomycetospora sp. NBRC 106375 TaxID=3032207 RepID=UPI0024A39849|nr:hypothetical protein [Actinomycetospora sp. NBRC 106375]GLZ50327.1 hypothetical protein Acsp06_65120 [Actinomycetospora sp. NBRC 106375]